MTDLTPRSPQTRDSRWWVQAYNTIVSGPISDLIWAYLLTVTAWMVLFFACVTPTEAHRPGASALGSGIIAAGLIACLPLILIPATSQLKSARLAARRPPLPVELLGLGFRNLHRIVIASGAALLFCWLFYRFGIPALPRTLTDRSPSQIASELDRTENMLTSPAWAQALHVVGEETLHRVPLVATMVILDRFLRPKTWLRLTIISGAVIADTAFFAYSHYTYSALNAVTAAITGLVFAIAAVWSRSIWPAISAHTVWNLVLSS